MESADDSSFSSLLSQMRSCYSKWEEIRKERDILKSSLEKANDKIVELETIVARYKAKDLVVEKERFLLSRVINTLHEELVKEGPISKKIDEIEEDVSWLSKAVEKSISDFDKRSSSIDSSNWCSEVYDNETQINNSEDVLIKNHKNKEPSGIDGIDLHHVTDKRHVYTPSACSDERPKPSILRQTLTQPVLNEGVNLREFSNLFSFYSTLFSNSENAQSKTVSMNNRTLEKGDCGVFLTDFIASSAQRIVNRGDSHYKSYSFPKNEIPITEVVRSSKKITTDHDKSDSSLSGKDGCNEVSSNEDIGIENPDDPENPSRISASSFESASSETAEEILRLQSSSDSSTLSNNECGYVENSNEGSAIQNSDQLENPAEISAMPLKIAGFNEVTENVDDVEMVGEDSVTESGKNSNYYCNEINEMSCVEIPNWRYNLRERKLVKNDKYSNGDEFSSSDYSSKKNYSSTKSEFKREESMKIENYLTVHGSTDHSRSVDSCSASEEPLSLPPLNSWMRIPDKTNSEHRKKCLICVKQNPTDPNPQFFSYRELDQHLLENHPKPYPIYTRCPYKEKNCIRHFRSRNNLRTHILLHQHQKEPLLYSQKNVIHQQKSWLCTFCGEMFAHSAELKNHVKREHFQFTKTSITCEYCKYVANSSKAMEMHKLKYHNNLACEFETGHPAKNITQEAANEKSDEKGEISSSLMVSSSTNRKKICTVCVICRKNNLGEMKFQSIKDLDSHISKYHPNPFPDYYPCPRRSDSCNRHFTSIRSLSNHLRGCPPKIKVQR